MKAPIYYLSTRGLTVASLHKHLRPLSIHGLRLLVATLPTDTFRAANDFCALTGLPVDVCRAFIKHNVNVAWEAHQILMLREQTNPANVTGNAQGEGKDAYTNN